ncbi:MAG: bifunctional precorrin-2 dehydrogenase/sirohydrochlorin ferrochelatase [Magnetococcales bacterium]|nr:bifunctional precorrin-2 dehydrogenase/sirohydrochlorin ferrochelatase [Magnetococcales bacterium]
MAHASVLGLGDSAPLLPLFVDLRGRTCLLVGADQGSQQEAIHKGQLLWRAGARLRWVGSQQPDWEMEDRVEWQQPPLQPDHLRDVWLIVSFSPDADVNRWLADQALERHIFFNAVDQTRYCSAIWPAYVERLPVQVALTTGGHSPALSGYLRRWLEGQLPVTLGAFAVWVASWRRRLAGHHHGMAQRARFWRQLLDHGLLMRYTEAGVEAAEAELNRVLALQEETDV